MPARERDPSLFEADVFAAQGHPRDGPSPSLRDQVYERKAAARRERLQRLEQHGHPAPSPQMPPRAMNLPQQPPPRPSHGAAYPPPHPSAQYHHPQPAAPQFHRPMPQPLPQQPHMHVQYHQPQQPPPMQNYQPVQQQPPHRPQPVPMHAHRAHQYHAEPRPPPPPTYQHEQRVHQNPYPHPPPQPAPPVPQQHFLPVENAARVAAFPEVMHHRPLAAPDPPPAGRVVRAHPLAAAPQAPPQQRWGSPRGMRAARLEAARGAPPAPGAQAQRARVERNRYGWGFEDKVAILNSSKHMPFHGGLPRIDLHSQKVAELHHQAQRQQHRRAPWE